MKHRIEGVDYLRAIMSIFVVIWHMSGGGRSLIFSENAYLEHTFTISDFVNFHLLLLAVPTFIFVSIFLFSLKPLGIAALRKQFVRIFILLSFWPFALILYESGYQGLLAVVPSSPVDFVYKALRAGNTIYYFFSSLVICLFTAYLFLQLSRRLQLSVFFISVVLLAALPQLTKMTGFFPLSAYWSPLNFIPFTFSAVLFAQHKEKIMGKKTVILSISVILCLCFSIFEWKYSVGDIFFPGQGYAIPAYTRTSLLFAVIAVFVLALNPKIEAGRAIKYMSRYSLALYCLHPFLMDPVWKFVNIFIHNNDTVAKYVSIMLVVVFSYAIAMLLKKYYLRDKVIV